MIHRVLLFAAISVVMDMALSSLEHIPVKEKRSFGAAPPKKKDIRDFNDADLERLYEQWEENDDEKLEDNELPAHKQPQKPMDFEAAKAKAKNTEELLSMSKKGQQVMMFVNIRDPSNPSVKDRPYTQKAADIFVSMLRNNHMVCQTFLIDDDRAILMFEDGSQAFEAKNFLLKQPQITEITLEGQTYVGAGASKKDEF